MDDDDNPFDMVLPFVCVESVGGPYADESFAAGFHLGQLDGHLAQRSTLRYSTLLQLGLSPEFRYATPTPSLAQLDLIAMRHGFIMEIEMDPEYNQPMHADDEWTLVVIRPAQDQPT